MAEDIKEILLKYKKEEDKIEIALQHLVKEKQILTQNQNGQLVYNHLTFEEASKRNKQILKDFEIVKGNLRSKAIYSPSEMQWERVCKKYKENPSLPVTTSRCYLPIFV